MRSLSLEKEEVPDIADLLRSITEGLEDVQEQGAATAVVQAKPEG